MANIELFDKYINGELSDSERNEFKERLESDKEFATDFNIYLVSVIGICKEAEQDNMDFGVAMKHLTKEQLFEIIGRKEIPISREEIIKRLRSRIILDSAQRTELSGAAALNKADDEYYNDEDTEQSNDKNSGNQKQSDSGNSLRRFTLIFIFIIVILIIISILL